MSSETPIDLPDSTPVYSPAQLAARWRSERRRAASMVAERDTVLGFDLAPLSPATYSRLLIMRSPFLWRGAATPNDVVDYLWHHTPAYAPGGRARGAFARRVQWRVAPPWLRWRYSRAAWSERLAAAYATAAEDIAELVDLAFADQPPPTGEYGGRVSASLEAQMVVSFARSCGWSPEYTRSRPLRQLQQYLRCGDGIDFDREEVDIIAEELRLANTAPLSAGTPQPL